MNLSTRKLSVSHLRRGPRYELSACFILGFDQFVANLKEIDNRNEAEVAVGGSAIHGISKFSDMSQDEFTKVFLNINPSKQPRLNVTVVDNIPPFKGAESSVDWTGVYTTPVKDQGTHCAVFFKKNVSYLHGKF
jgi:hypothetical protein